jgi:hypothetical protein
MKTTNFNMPKRIRLFQFTEETNESIEDFICLLDTFGFIGFLCFLAIVLIICTVAVSVITIDGYINLLKWCLKIP